jgi:hypothetical protein
MALISCIVFSILKTRRIRFIDKREFLLLVPNANGHGVCLSNDVQDMIQHECRPLSIDMFRLKIIFMLDESISFS